MVPLLRLCRGAGIPLAFLGLFLVALPAASWSGEPGRLRGDAVAHSEEADRLFSFLAEARTEAEARAMEGEIWRHWLLPPDTTAADLMERALDRRRNHDFAGAIAFLDRLIGHAPDWAEAWNQRATIRFMQGEQDASLADIEETLAREPRHFGAMAGMAIILMQQGRMTQAQAILKKAVGIHPFLRERSMIVSVPEEEL